MESDQIAVQVTVWVEEGIVPLVLALNDLAGVETIESAQGDELALARVSFRSRGGPREAAALGADLAIALAPYEGVADYTLMARWQVGAVEPVYQLMCPPEHVLPLAMAIREAPGLTRESDRPAQSGERPSGPIRAARVRREVSADAGRRDRSRRLRTI